MKSGCLAVCLALGLPAAISAASAEEIRSREQLARIAGEVAAGRIECNFAFNLARLREISRPFQVAGPDDPAIDVVSDLMVQGMNEALSLLRDEGTENACPRLLEAYGPQGSISPGLLNSPGSE